MPRTKRTTEERLEAAKKALAEVEERKAKALELVKELEGKAEEERHEVERIRWGKLGKAIEKALGRNVTDDDTEAIANAAVVALSGNGGKNAIGGTGSIDGNDVPTSATGAGGSPKTMVVRRVATRGDGETEGTSAQVPNDVRPVATGGGAGSGADGRSQGTRQSTLFANMIGGRGHE